MFFIQICKYARSSLLQERFKYEMLTYIEINNNNKKHLLVVELWQHRLKMCQKIEKYKTN